jgi:ankyrin repeat protein
MKSLIETKNYAAIRQTLADNQSFANEGIPFSQFCHDKAHPLHRICDAVFAKKITEDEAVKIAKIFLEYGSKVDGNELVEKHDTPLIAAASLHADAVAILYLENGADISHRGCHGGTALHWAAWCGRSKIVKKLIECGAEINLRCLDHKATPLFWAFHGLKSGGKTTSSDHLECVKLLLEEGADKTIPNGSGDSIFDMLDENDLEFREILK